MRRTPRLHPLPALLLALSLALSAQANTVADWNKFALDHMASSNMDLLEAERALAILQIAVYEAANAVQPTYVRSSIALPNAPGASLDAAITEAAYRTLIALAPPTAAAAEAERNRRLATIPDSPAKRAGIATGAAAAQAILADRANDGADFSHTYTPGSGPGAYLPTSPRPMAGPRAAHMRPFRLTSYAAFRPPPPPPLDSPQMRRDLEEVALYGAKDSTARTPEQTEIGVFHVQPGIYGWSNIARQTAGHLHLDEVKTAHLLAAVSATIVDSQFAVWDAKYTYNFWRPITALHDHGGPLNLSVPPGWTPLIPTPMIPEYPCAHCGSGSALQTVLEGLAGTGPIDFTVQSGTVTRHYTSFRQYAEEESISRIYGGVHLRWSNYTGEAIGRQVGASELAAVPRLLGSKP